MELKSPGLRCPSSIRRTSGTLEERYIFEFVELLANPIAFRILSGIVVALRPFVFVSSDAMTLSDQTWLYPCARVSADGKNTMERQPPELRTSTFLMLYHHTIVRQYNQISAFYQSINPYQYGASVKIIKN